MRLNSWANKIFKNFYFCERSIDRKIAKFKREKKWDNKLEEYSNSAIGAIIEPIQRELASGRRERRGTFLTLNNARA